MSTKPIPYVLKKDYISVVVNKQSHSVDSTSPIFKKLKKALEKKDWLEIPKLISVASTISNESKGAIEVKKDKVFFKGEEVHNEIANRIISLLVENKPIKHLVWFM